MLTRREKLLIRPWQQRRYNNHRRKVQSALPAIDVGPPTLHGHVCCKLKKQQNEQERMARIERDNCRLLQRMGTIMRTKRLDNEWTKPPVRPLLRRQNAIACTTCMFLARDERTRYYKTIYQFVVRHCSIAHNNRIK
ncbi:hypothetical protein L9F63_002911 [Diploptera punctata]|uniref:Uncharacterized protein n=1 Tax=Diploptera punctata TaxID=6984 RepID=A0AAD8ECR8_DIPPU|nr:hypothetical protein L9F63_002911 [Diploptera punctata]